MKITFFTTTTNSDIQITQSECIKKHFPDSQHLLIDGRNALDREKWRAAGWRVHALGRTD